MVFLLFNSFAVERETRLWPFGFLLSAPEPSSCCQDDWSTEVLLPAGPAQTGDRNLYIYLLSPD
jgi:hypothetical protein